MINAGLLSYLKVISPTTPVPGAPGSQGLAAEDAITSTAQFDDPDEFWDQRACRYHSPQTIPKHGSNIFQNTHQDVLFPPTCTHGPLWGLLMEDYGVRTSCTHDAAPMD